jgi:hypothetical protein
MVNLLDIEDAEARTFLSYWLRFLSGASFGAALVYWTGPTSVILAGVAIVLAIFGYYQGAKDSRSLARQLWRDINDHIARAREYGRELERQAMHENARSED